MTLVVLAAGMGSRYGGLKQIDPIGPNGEFIIDYSISDAIKSGFDKVVFIIKKENLEDFRSTIGKRFENKINVDYVFQGLDVKIPSGCRVNPERQKPLGTAHALLCCEDAIKENFAVINADDFYGREAFEKIAEFLKTAKTSADKKHYAMVSYELTKTLSDNGSVARGVCKVSHDGYLDDVDERTKIQKNGNDIEYFENDVWNPLDKDSYVSMNFWGFTPEIFDTLRRDFPPFLNNNYENIKAEYLLPMHVKDLLKAKLCDVRVLKTSAKWYGVTYREDKEEVKKFLLECTQKGIY